MGIMVSKEKRESEIIDKTIKSDQIKKSHDIRILLLGSGQSGKTTILKQMRIFNHHEFTFEELNYYKTVIVSNVSAYLLTLLGAMKTFGITFNDCSLQANADRFLDQLQCGDDLEFSPESVTIIQMIWSDPGMSKCYDMRNQLQLPECVKYFLDSVERVTDKEYIPSYQDVLYVRSPTTGVTEITFNRGKHDDRVFDVGGQRSERRKWLHCFDDIDCMIFLTAVSEYDLVLEEDTTKNRAHDSLDLFEAVAGLEFFIKKNVILFLNKIDLFKEKIQEVPLIHAFPMYNGLQNYERGIAFIRNEFEKRAKNKERTIKMHETCATDTNQVKVVIHTVIVNVMNYNRLTSGFC